MSSAPSDSPNLSSAPPSLLHSSLCLTGVSVVSRLLLVSLSGVPDPFAELESGGSVCCEVVLSVEDDGCCVYKSQQLCSYEGYTVLCSLASCMCHI